MNVIAITLRTSAVLMALILMYQLAVTGIAQAFMPDKANGSLVYNDKGEIIGSELIGQSFADPNFFHGRVSSIDYNAAGSGTPNYAPSNPDLLARTQKSLAAWQAANPDVPVSKVPIDLVTNSGSGLDPHISPQAAAVQIPRVGRATGLSEEKLRQLVARHTEGRDWGLFGEPRVNVLKLNIELQSMLN